MVILGEVPINRLGMQLTQMLITAASQIPDPTRDYMSVFEKTAVHVGGLSEHTSPRALKEMFAPYLLRFLLVYNSN